MGHPVVLLSMIMDLKRQPSSPRYRTRRPWTSPWGSRCRSSTSAATPSPAPRGSPGLFPFQVFVYFYHNNISNPLQEGPPRRLAVRRQDAQQGRQKTTARNHKVTAAKAQFKFRAQILIYRERGLQCYSVNVSFMSL